MLRRSISNSKCKHFRAVLVRLVFMLHALWAVYLCVVVTKQSLWWSFAGSLALLLLEAVFTLRLHHGQEYQYFCPSIFFYCLCLFPPVWVMELHLSTQNHTLDYLTSVDLSALSQANKLSNHVLVVTESPDTTPVIESTATDVPIEIEELIVSGSVELPARRFRRSLLTPTASAMPPILVYLDSHTYSVIKQIYSENNATFYLQCTVQLLLVLVILGRWALPKGKLTHDQLSQLLLVYFGDAADIAEFFDSLNDKAVSEDELMCMIVLACWSLSVIRFSIVIAEKEMRDRRCSRPSVMAFVSPVFRSDKRKLPGCFDYITMEVIGISTNILMQNAPYLGVRLYMILHFQIVNYTNMFFAAKNMFTIILMVYRLAAIFHRISDEKREEIILLAEQAAAVLSDGDAPVTEETKRSRKVCISPEPDFYFGDANENESDVCETSASNGNNNSSSYGKQNDMGTLQTSREVILDTRDQEDNPPRNLLMHETRPPADRLVNLQCGTETLTSVAANTPVPPCLLSDKD